MKATSHPAALSFVLLSLGTWLANPAAFAATLAGVALQPTMRVQGRTLELVSCGVRDSLWIDHYVAGLYIPKGATPKSAADADRAKAVRLHVVQAQFLPENIPEKWRGALKEELAREPMLKVRTAYDKLSDGDVVTFSYVPQHGTTMTVNGRTVVQTPGHAVIESILSAWAEKDPVTGKLQRLQLKHPC